MSGVVNTEDRLREAEAALTRRIEYIEHENQKLRRTNGRMLATLAAVLGLSLATLAVVAVQGRAGRVASVVQARSFVLVDDEGVVRGEWRGGEDGAPQLALRDSEGRARLRLSVLADGSSGLVLSGRDTRPRAVLGVLPDQTTNLVLADAEGRTRAVMGTGGNTATVLFADQEGVTRAMLGADARGNGDLTIYESRDTPVQTEVAEMDTATAALSEGD
jgi:hypothetical protein